MRLFIDVDDTLVRWLDLEGNWEPNEKVIHFANEWRKFHPQGEIVVWSLGGKDYAGQWRWRLLPFAHRYEAKWPRIPEPGDIFIDDDPLETYRSATIHPEVLR